MSEDFFGTSHRDVHSTSIGHVPWRYILNHMGMSPGNLQKTSPIRWYGTSLDVTYKKPFGYVTVRYILRTLQWDVRRTSVWDINWRNIEYHDMDVLGTEIYWEGRYFLCGFVQNHTLKFILTVWYGDKFKSVQIATNTLIIKIYACKIQQKDK